MKEQNFANHRRLSPAFHFGLMPSLLIYTGIAAFVLYRHYTLGWGLSIPSLLVLSGLFLIITAFFARSFALKAQDRAIRAEEALRYFAITGSLPDNRLTLRQIIALRFAPNNELMDLAHLAVEKDLSANEIKKAIKNWKADYDRV